MACAALAGVPEAAAADRPVLLGLVIDTSGSVGPAELARTRDLALQVMAALPAGSEVAVYTFDDESRLVLPRTSSTDAVRRALAAVHVAGHRTALYDALYDASRDLEPVTGMARALLLVTDGKDEDSALALEDGLKRAQQSRIPVFAVGVGRVQERTLRRIAKLTGGLYEPSPGARTDALAARIAAAAVLGPAAADASPAQGAASVGVAASPTARTAAAPEPAGGVPTPGRPRWPLWIGLGALLAVVGAAVLALRGHGGDEHAPTADGRLGLETVVPPPVPQGARPPEPDEDASDSPTVIAGLNSTEEYLEKTVTLRERPVLILAGAGGGASVFELRRDSATSIGRSKANDVVLQDVTVSSQHCRVRPLGDAYEVLDLRSTNGTFVNEQRVQRQALREGDELRLGDVVLRFRRQHSRS